MQNKVFKSYSDPGHGWLAVKRSDLHALGIADKITRCSYQRGQTVYLEEDQDVMTFVVAFQNKFGVKPNMKEQSYTNSSSPIRSYEPYKAT